MRRIEERGHVAVDHLALRDRTVLRAQEAKEVVDETILDAQREGRTVILATHDPSRGGMASRTMFMDGGRLGP